MDWIFTAEGVPPKLYNKVLTREFGAEWQTWLPETLMQEIKRVWGVDVSDNVANKLGAYVVFLTTDEFMHNASAFEHIVQAINDAAVDPTILTLSSPSEIVYALLMLGPIDGKLFEREVIAYIRACCDAVGLVLYPEAIQFAQPKYDSGEIRAMLPKIQSRQMEGDDTDPIVQQSNKLFKINQDIVDRLAEFRFEVKSRG